MKIERTKNAARNITFGVAQKIYQVAVPFIMRTVMIYTLGVEYLGLSSLFTSVLSVLNMAELGVGAAMVYSMYKPIAEDDTDTICALMGLYRKYYRIIGIVIAALGLAILPLVPKLIKSDLPSDVNVYILYILSLSATVLSYWLFAYKNCILSAHQRNDLPAKVQLFTNTVQYIFQFAILILFKNYYVYLIVALCTQAATNIFTAIVATKYYPQYKPNGKLDKAIISDINKRIRDLFTAKIGGVIVNSVDTLVISAFLGLTALAIYQNYFYIITSIIGFISIIFNSCTAGIGNSIVVESKEKNFNDLKKFTFIISWLAGFCSTCLLCLFQPFMDIWVGSNLKLGFSVVVCLCIYFFVYEINQLLNLYKDASGIWHEDRLRPLVTALGNLTLNLIMVQFLGIYGVILSTVVSMICIGMPWLLHNLFTTIFDKKLLLGYLKILILYFVVAIIAAIATLIICGLIKVDNAYLLLLIRGVICCFVPNSIFYLFYSNKQEFKEAITLIDNMTNNKFKLRRILRNKRGNND